VTADWKILHSGPLHDLHSQQMLYEWSNRGWEWWGARCVTENGKSQILLVRKPEEKRSLGKSRCNGRIL